jgi:hypothetical protein
MIKKIIQIGLLLTVLVSVVSLSQANSSYTTIVPNDYPDQY